MAAFKIAIIGAGPAGCMLARLLHQANIPVTIFEADAFLDVRSQGGTLDLHTKTGLAAMTEAGLYNEFLKHARFDGEAMVVCDKKLKRYINVQGSKKQNASGRPEIDRFWLRSILADSIPKDIVRWNHRLRSIGDDLSLHFDSGSEKGFDLIIGADGAWSKVRPLLSQVKPFYSGVGGHSLTIPNAAETAPEVYKLINRGSLFAFSDGKSISGQQLGDGSIAVSAWTSRDESWMQHATYNIHGADTKKALSADYSDWTPELQDFIHNADNRITPRSLYMLPIGHRWEHRAGITLVGDAAHLMTPFAGEGVNLAFEDAMKLSQAIIAASREPSTSTAANNPSSLDALYRSIAAYEIDMFERATRVQQLTFDMMNDMYFTPGAPRSSIDKWVMRKVRFDVHWALSPLVGVLVSIWFFWVRLCV